MAPRGDLLGRPDARRRAVPQEGRKVYIEGQLQTRKWQDQSGADKYSTEVVLQGFNSNLTMLDGRAGRRQPGGFSGPRSEGGFSAPAERPARRPAASAPAFEGGADDDIPF